MLRGLFLLLNITGIPRLVTRLVLDRRVPWRLKLILPGALLYIISPLDFAPDMLSVFGRIDDVLVLLISLALFLGLAPRDVVSEHMRSTRTGARSRAGTPKDRKTVIDGEYHIVDDSDR